MYLISACLIGENCKYDGGNNYHEIANKLFAEGLAVPVCPEELGGLPTPRVPSEIQKNRVFSNEGIDVTKEFLKGASRTLQIAKEKNIKIAILQKRSPSCGVHQVYDGTFSSILIEGEGKTTELLRMNGIEVITIEDYVDKYYSKDFK